MERKRINSYRGWYRGIRCDSRWELAFLIYHMDKKIPIQRCEQFFEYMIGKTKHRYYPDFIVNGYFIEIKGHFRMNLNEKLRAVRIRGYKIKLIEEKGIEKYLNYCREKYHTNELQKLYERKGKCLRLRKHASAKQNIKRRKK